MEARQAGRTIKKILIIDDEESMRFLLSYALEAAGFKVTTAENGAQAWKLFIKETYDLVITDFQMPGIDGLRLAENIKRRCSAVPVILISGSDLDQIRGCYAARNIDRLVAKPFRISDMRDIVLQMLFTVQKKKKPRC
ncbi:MAG: response regulator [Desulfobacteraceae bacterium]|nr:MAG: response regulator [Desulfobacteraceae bacterium]